MLTFNKHFSAETLNKFKSRTADRNEKRLRDNEILKAWDEALNAESADLKVVHCISSRSSVSHIGRNVNTSPFLLQPVDVLLSGWDVISTSCIGKKILPDGRVLGVAPLDIHLNLKVPVQNIIGTHHRDVCFNNFAGLENNLPGGRVIDSAMLAKSIFNGIERPNKIGFKMNEPYNILRHPDEFRRNMEQAIGSYNEIIIIGRPGVKLYIDFPCTNAIKLTSISFRPNYIRDILITGRLNDMFIRNFREDMIYIKRLLRMNNVNKVIFSLGRVPAFKYTNIASLFEESGFRKQSDTIFLLS